MFWLVVGIVVWGSGAVGDGSMDDLLLDNFLVNK